MKENEENRPEVEVDLNVSDKGLSLKAKGAGILFLLFLSISGMIYVAYLISSTGGQIALFLPLLFLLFVTYQLINLAHGVFRTGMYIDNS